MFKKLVLAAALAAAAPAMAAIGNASSGNGELFLAIGNPIAGETSRITYVYDLGISMDSFLPGSAAAQTSFSRALPNFSTFLSQITTAGSSASELSFAVIALDSVGSTTTAGSLRLMTTANLPAGEMNQGTNTDSFQNQDVAAITSVSSPIVRFVTATNALASHNSAANGDSIRARQGATDAADYGNAFVDSLGFGGSQLNFAAGTAVGELARFVLASNTAGAPNAAATVFNFSAGGADVADIGSNLVSTFGVVLDGENASLVYTAAIPEPGEVAFMLAGLGIAGAIARRRRARA